MRENSGNYFSGFLLEKIQNGEPGLIGYKGFVKLTTGDIVQVYQKGELSKVVPMLFQLTLRDELQSIKVSAELSLGETQKIDIDGQELNVVMSDRGPLIIKRIITKK